VLAVAGCLQSAWYITLVMQQFWHIWLCKTRQVGQVLGGS
jgi:hypothetical protein